jgi:hypothetical protein
MSEKHNSLEEYVAELVRGLADGEDSYARPSKASGASTENYDIQTKFPLAIECKQQRTKKNATIDKATWEKLKAEIPWNSDRYPLLVIENSSGDKFAVLSLESFMDIFDTVVHTMYKGD